jgi:hypothetical protein
MEPEFLVQISSKSLGSAVYDGQTLQDLGIKPSMSFTDMKYKIRDLTPICQGIVRTDYIKKQINQATTVAIIFQGITRQLRNRVTVDYQPVGFLIGYDIEDGFYLDVICSAPGTGRYLLTAFIQYYRSRSAGAITLSALPTVLTYYPRFGFTFRKSCMEAPLQIPPEIEFGVANRVANKAVPGTIEQAYDDPVFEQLLEYLQYYDYNVKKDGCSPNDIKRIKQNDCGEDGYTMKLCPNMIGGKRKRTTKSKKSRT